jgi:hypothetical protein
MIALVALLAQLLAPHAAGETKCAACHTAEGWQKVRFDHARTGFALAGAHQQAACRACHGGDFATAQPTSCSGCHQDPHAGDRGPSCAGCHDERSWAPLFTADAHRRTNFPLTGRHALLPCTECHQETRDRTFTRSTKACFDCHSADYARTAGGAVDHAAANFPQTCRACHDPFHWKPARFAQHDHCFQLSVGKHAGIACLDCHSSLAGARPDGTCSTGTAKCQRCHACADVTPKHPPNIGFQCADLKCYQCHRFSFDAPGGVRPTRRVR